MCDLHIRLIGYERAKTHAFISISMPPEMTCGSHRSKQLLELLTVNVKRQRGPAACINGHVSLTDERG
jgi:hypothetical protein